MNIRPTALLLALLASGCASLPSGPVAPTVPLPEVATDAGATMASPPAASAVVATEKPVTPSARSSTRVFPGTDRMIKADIAPKIDPVLTSSDKVSLNFENAPLGNLAHALLGDLLQLNYSIDAGADTIVSLRTRQPLARNQVLDVLDAVLLPHDLAIVRDNAGVYHVTKRNVTIGARPVVGASRFKDLAGAGTVIATLNHIAAAEMAKILAPIAPKESIVYVDTFRNLIVLQGSKAQLGGWLDLVDAFDVDFLSGMSLGVFVMEHANVNDLRDALQVILGSDGLSGAPSAASSSGTAGTAAAMGAAGISPLGGLIKVFPVERLNALVVVTPRRQLLDQVETWVRRLDRPADGLEAGLFVYPVQNGSAVYLAEMLNGLFGGDASRASSGVAAGSAPTQIARSPTGANAGGAAANVNTALRSNTTSGSGVAGSNSLAPVGSTGAGAAQTTSVSRLEGNVRVVADVKRNALLIRAPRHEYRRIEQALRELDRAPAQVLIEASIVEVSLTGNLKYGVDWYLQNGLSGDRQGQALLNMRSSGTVGANTTGFSYTILNKAGVVRAALNALSEKSQVRVLSNPSVLVLDNHNATIQIGRQQPIKSATTVTSSSVVTENITYKDTGVMLSVTPSVNAGGLVTMDIAQTVTDVGEIDAATGQRNFLSRQIQSRVAVRSGESIVLGGLIRENETRGRSGVPGMADIPLLGALFSTNTDNSDRTELLVLLTPRALEDDDALRAASAELRQRMQTLTLQFPLGVAPIGGQDEPRR